MRSLTLSSSKMKIIHSFRSLSCSQLFSPTLPTKNKLEKWFCTDVAGVFRFSDSPPRDGSARKFGLHFLDPDFLEVDETGVLDVEGELGAVCADGVRTDGRLGELRRKVQK
jgi:hypothetical protein